VDYYFPNKFYISWDFQEIKEKKNEAKKQIPLSALSSLAVVPSQSQSNQQTQLPSQTVQPLQTQHRQTNKPQIIQQPFTHPLHYNSNTQSNSYTHTNFDTSQTQQNNPLQYMQNIPSEIQQKMMTPLPLAPPKYDPYDVHVNAQDALINSTSSKPVNNTFFPKNPMEYKPTWNPNQQSPNIKEMMGLLTSSIGTQHKNIFDYKPSGKLSLNI
jgi:hypothetical protein